MDFCLVLLVPFTIASGQDKKNEQKIKIVIADDGGSEVILDTLITGNTLSDSIILKNGKTIYLAREEGDDTPGCKKYVITATVPDGDDNKKQISKEVTIIASDDMQGENGNCKVKHITSASSGNANTYSYTITSDDKVSDSERTRYVIDRDGIKITVEGSDYDKVKELTKEIEKTLDAKSREK